MKDPNNGLLAKAIIMVLKNENLNIAEFGTYAFSIGDCEKVTNDTVDKCITEHEYNL